MAAGFGKHLPREFGPVAQRVAARAFIRPELREGVCGQVYLFRRKPRHGGERAADAHRDRVWRKRRRLLAAVPCHVRDHVGICRIAAMAVRRPVAGPQMNLDIALHAAARNADLQHRAQKIWPRAEIPFSRIDHAHFLAALRKHPLGTHVAIVPQRLHMALAYVFARIAADVFHGQQAVHAAAPSFSPSSPPSPAVSRSLIPSPYIMSNSAVLNGAASLFFTTVTRVLLPTTMPSGSLK